MPDALPADPAFLGLAQAAALVATRRLSSVELTQALIARAEALDGQLRSYLTPCFDRALEEARAADAALAGGGSRGPLHGVPFGLKDIFDVAGMPTTGQSRAYRDKVAREDGEAVRRLRAAGGVLLGKLSTHECAHGGPSFDLFAPPARNPWDTARFTGGSSSGSGAAVAAGLMPLALGSDTGGSIRIPAALCGLVGLKPTYGRVSRRGVMPNAFGWDHVGPMTWTVEDCALALQVLAGHDAGDPTSAPVPVPDYRAALTGELRGLRVGVLRHFFEEDLPVPAGVAHALEEAFAVLRSLGAELREVRIRPSRDYAECKIIAAESEIFAVHEPALRERPDAFGEDFLTRILPAVMIRGADYVQANRLRAEMTRELEALHREVDVLVTAAPGPAPLLSAWRPANFWRGHGSHVPVFNVTGAPALVQCIGFADGLPLSFQIAGRPFEEATVLRVAHAYEKATGGRARRPRLDPGAAAPELPPLPEPEPSSLSPAEEGRLRDLLARARIRPGERAFRHLCSVAPHVEIALERLHRPAAFSAEPAGRFFLDR